MATLYTPTWGNSNSPRMYIDWSYSSSATSVTYSWTAYYTASYAAYTNGNARSWSVTVNGTAKSGSYNINGVTGTKTLGSGSVTVPRTHASQTVGISISMNMDVTWNGTYAGTVSNSTSDGMSALASYSVSYSANGGTGAPGAQTKWHGEALTLSSAAPTRAGYTFQGWATSSNAASAAYAAGGSYTANSAATLYAVWKVVAPAAPASCSSARASDSKNSVSWERGALADATYAGIEVERRVDGGSWSNVATLAGTATSYADTATAPDHSYAYRVRAVNATGKSAYAASGTTYNTPAAPASVTASRLAEATVALAIENASNTATALELQRSADGESWEAAATVDGLVTSATDSPGGGTFWYRARNTRGALASAWSPASNAVVTICAPAAPDLASPASGAVVRKSLAQVALSWAHSPIDGSAQTAAQVACSTDGGSTWETHDVSGAAQELAVANFALNAEVTWRVRTKGAHADFGPWSATRTFSVRQEPSVAFASPASGFVVENTPVAVELQYSDASGSLAAASVEVRDASGLAVWSRDLGTAASCSIPAAEWLPEDGAAYELRASVRSTSSLTASAVREVSVDFELPRPPALSVEPDPETGFVAIVANVGEGEGLEEPASVSVWRVSDAGRVLLGEALPEGAGLVDRYAPLNADYAYEAATFADSGAANRASFPARVDTPWWFVYYDGGAARAMWEPSGRRKPERTRDELVERDGSEWPVLVQGRSKSLEVEMSGWVETRAEAAAFEAMALAAGDKVFKGLLGDVFHCAAEVSMTDSYEYGDEGAEVSVTVRRVRGGEL